MINSALYLKRYKQKRRRKARILLACFFMFVAGCFAYIFAVVNPVVVEAARQEILSLSASAVSDSVQQVLTEENISYDDLVKFERDGEGNILLISLSTVNLNLITRQIYQVAQEKLDEMGTVGVGVNFGAFTGLPFLSGVGPKIQIKLVSIGAMECDFESSFISAGINQTNHSVFVNFHASVSMILPCFSSTVSSDTQVLVAESIIVGSVPSFYLSGESLKFDAA